MQLVTKANNQKTNIVQDSVKAIFIQQTEPMGGLWFAKTAHTGFDPHLLWQMRDGRIDWQPYAPANAPYWAQRINELAEEANQKRHSGAFLKLSKTQQHTQPTWSLPAIASAPI